MESQFINLVLQKLKSLDWPTVLSLSIVGIILIIVNTVIHWTKEVMTNRLKKAQSIRDTVDKPKEALKRRADDLIARFCNLSIEIAEGASAPTDKLVQVNDNSKYLEHLKTLSTDRLDWTEITAFRMLEFLWAAYNFRKKTEEVINDPEAMEIEYYLVDKMPLVLRGKIYGANFFTREDQEELTLFFYNTKVSSIEGPTLRNLVNLLHESEEARRIFSKLVRFIARKENSIQKLAAGDIHSEDARKLSITAHFTIYLIDLYQRLAYSSKWEEYRVILVRILKRVNDNRDTSVYLYYPKDILQRSYFLSYPEDILETRLSTILLTRIHMHPFSFPRQWGFRYALFWRTKRFIHRHHRKRIGDGGIKITVNSMTYKLSLHDSLENCVNNLKHYLQDTHRRMP